MKSKTVFTLFSAVLMTTLSAAQASASWFQTNCSNGEATTQLFDGHNRMEIVLTERVWGRGDSGLEETKVSLDPREVQITVLASKSLYKKENEGCSGDNTGYYSSKKIEYRQVSISKADGSAFSTNIVGASEDGKSVEALLICELDLTSVMPCQ